MQERLLHHIYQAWQQGNENYVIEYKEFVIYSSKQMNMSFDEMLDLLKRYKWFQYI
jgi:hypothetical protein